MPLHLRAFLRHCHRPLLRRLGAWPFSHWAPCLGQGQHFMPGKMKCAVLKCQFPQGATLGKRK